MNKITKDDALSTERALKLALEALEEIGDQWGFTSKRTIPNRKAAITAICEALMSVTDGASGANEQPAPVAEVREQQEPDYNICPTCGGMASDPIVPPSDRLTSKPWVGLTDDEIALICAECSLRTPCDIYYARAIEAKLKEKNGF